MSHFDGFLEECDRRIVVDDFDIARLRLNNAPLAQRPLFFLSHAHTDHMRGLDAEWDFAPIYTSTVTRALVLGRFRSFRRPELLIAFDSGDRRPLPLPMGDPDDIVTVTALPANHIAGALMFLFQWHDGVRARSVLHTGDFRFAAKMASYEAILTAEARVDQLVLDTTFVAQKWRHFPTRAESIDEVLRLIDEHRRTHGAKAKVYLGCDNIGYEPLFEAIYERYGERVCLTSVLWLQLHDILDAQRELGQTRDFDDAEGARAAVEAGIIERRARFTYHDADSARVDVYTRNAETTSFFVVPFQLCADAAGAARVDVGTLTGELSKQVRARATRRRERRVRLLREGRASSPTLIATSMVGCAALDDATHERPREVVYDSDTESLDKNDTRDWAPSTHVDHVTGIPFDEGAAAKLRMTKDFHSGTGLLMQISTQFFRERHCRTSEKFQGVWRVLYSNHSSRSELEQFVRLVQPRTVRSLLREVESSDAAWLK